MNSTRSARPSSPARRSSGAALGAVADDPVAQRGMPVAQQRHRAQHVGVALAGDEVGDGHEQRRSSPPARRAGGQVGPEVHDARPPRAERAARRLDARAVGEHEPRARRTRAAPPRGRPSWSGAVWKTSLPCTETTSGARDPGAQHRVARGHRVVGVDEVEREAPPQAPQRDRERRRRPRAPGPVRPRARRRDEAHVLDLDPVERRAARLAQRGAASRASRSRGGVESGGIGR